MSVYLDQEFHVVPLLEPTNITANATNTDVFGLKYYHAAEIIVQFGTITGDSVVITLKECVDTTPSNSTAIAFKYKKTPAVGTGTGVTWSTATTSGVTFSATDDNKTLIIGVESSQLSSGYTYLMATITPGTSMSACYVSAVAILRPRYAKDYQIDAVS